jgi:hypothetical protein
MNSKNLSFLSLIVAVVGLIWYWKRSQATAGTATVATASKVANPDATGAEPQPIAATGDGQQVANLQKELAAWKAGYDTWQKKATTWETYALSLEDKYGA